ncbi:MAG: cell wall hydrolase [Caulobacteraceae bacterium]
MFSWLQARGEARALIAAALLGGGFGVALGGAYLAGGMAKAAADQVRVARLHDAAEAGFSEDALRREAAGMDASTLSLARAADPVVSDVVFTSARGRQAQVIAARLERTAGRPGMFNRQGLMRVTLAAPTTTEVQTAAAQPYRFGGALGNSRDLDCLASAVYYEARGEGGSGMAAVAQVVLNRVRHPAFPKTVCGVVFQGANTSTCQFSFACDGSMRRPRETAAWTRARAVAARALGGYVMTDVGNATHFHTTWVAPGWRGMLRITQVGTHIFYRFGGRAGLPGAFTGSPAPSGPGSDAPAYAVSAPAAPSDGQSALIVANATLVQPATTAAVPDGQAAPAPVSPPARPPEAAAATPARESAS